jgi:hypothetical protein
MDKIGERLLEPDSSGIPLQAFELSLEVYIMLHDVPAVSFTLAQIKKMINDKYNENVGYKRIRQICEGMAQRGRISELKQINPANGTPCRTYQANGKSTVLMDSQIWRIAKRIEEL